MPQPAPMYQVWPAIKLRWNWRKPLAGEMMASGAGLRKGQTDDEAQADSTRRKQKRCASDSKRCRPKSARRPLVSFDRAVKAIGGRVSRERFS